jgi:hypothetical protein
MALTGTGETLVLDTLIVGRFISLHTSLPPTGEVATAGTGYARQPAALSLSTSPDPTVYKNSGIIQYPLAILDWGTITHFGFWSAATGGNLFAYAPVTVAKQVTANDIVRWEANALTVSTD